MGKFQDLTGKKLGKLDVIRRIPGDSRHIKWECRCECGRIKNIDASNLTSGRTKSCGYCGCSNRGSHPFDNLSGKKFGHLTVISFAHRNKHGRAMWNCLCDCGKEKIVSGSNLKNGSTISCGCSHFETKHDLTGKRFGRLVVIQRVESKRRGVTRYECACDCGAICQVDANPLVSNLTISCGCYNRENFKNLPHIKVRTAYENLYGCIPDGYKVTPLDGNYNNTSSDNLVLISNAARQAMRKDGILLSGWDVSADVKMVAIQAYELAVMCNKIERGLT